MEWQKKLAKICALLFLIIGIAACEGSGCVEADEFDSNSVKVESNPELNGVFGTYDNVDGGQVAEWKSTGLKTNNEDFVILISGSWVPWYGQQSNDEKLEKLSRCKTCDKRNNDKSENCICYRDETPQQEITPSGRPSDNECSLAENQNNPNACTCTILNGKATDYGVFHFPLTYYNKDHERKLPDDQGNLCKYDRGMGLFLGVFGKSNNEIPLRAYHLFSEDEICTIIRNSDGECIDDHGKNRLKYIFRSANAKTLVKDDLAGNNGIDANPNDDIYHKPHEYVKLIIYDSFYSDNFGFYNVNFLNGVAKDGETGLLEYLVAIVEDSVLGEYTEQGVRDGGVLKFMYNSITQDLYFMAVLQALLVIYIAFFGMSSLFGLVELTKKEIYSRIIKIAVITFFTRPESWEFYRQIVVGFFKDSMDFAIAFVTNLAESNLSQDESPLLIAASGSSYQGGAASRFSYIDNIIKTLFSDPVTKKIWGLFFDSILGLIYIILIYFIIGFFIYVMLLAAAVYAVTLMKLIFALALGPIFISFALFKFTEDMFKKWIGFLGARSLEMLILFLILYMLVMLIDKQFNHLLYYRACIERLDLGLFSLKILRSYPHRGFVDWLSAIITIAGLIFMLKLIMGQIPSLAGELISIGGAANSAGGGVGSFKMASGLVGKAFSNASGALKTSLTTVGGKGFRALRTLSRASGLSAKIDKAFDKIPIRGPRTRLRDNTIKEAIRAAKVDAHAKGLKGAAFDKAVRNHALNDLKTGLLAWRNKNPQKAALYDMSTANMLKGLDNQLTKEPLEKFLKKKAKSLKKNLKGSEIPLGKEMNKRLKEEARIWADKNLAGGRDSIGDHLHNMKDLMHKHGKLSAKEAAKKFAGSDSLKERYMRHLKDEELRKGKKQYDLSSDKSKVFERQTALSSDKSRDFMRNVFRKENKRLIPLHDGLRSQIMSEETMRDAMRNFISSDAIVKDHKEITTYYDKKIKGLKDGTQKRLLETKKQEKLKELENKRKSYMTILERDIEKQMQTKYSATEREQLRPKLLQDLKDITDKQDRAIAEIAGK